MPPDVCTEADAWEAEESPKTGRTESACASSWVTLPAAVPTPSPSSSWSTADGATAPMWQRRGERRGEKRGDTQRRESRASPKSRNEARQLCLPSVGSGATEGKPPTRDKQLGSLILFAFARVSAAFAPLLLFSALLPESVLGGLLTVLNMLAAGSPLNLLATRSAFFSCAALVRSRAGVHRHACSSSPRLRYAVLIFQDCRKLSFAQLVFVFLSKNRHVARVADFQCTAHTAAGFASVFAKPRKEGDIEKVQEKERMTERDDRRGLAVGIRRQPEDEGSQQVHHSSIARGNQNRKE
ncbi:putative transmembrane protein [Toxoplasma gondii p89]|uniref:Putative transmembrane protein n=1 Tax=Toxoplasma gondii p89 TaxID=943119 RepID=A0A086J874_TOXGO|nr:putative transmembrane protein [Toxoplasma gondii p89]